MSSHNLSSPLVGGRWLDISIARYEILAGSVEITIKHLALIGAFYLLGRLLGNTRAIRDSTLLAIALLLHHRNLIYQSVVHTSARSTLYYLLGTFFVQSAAAAWLQQTTKQYAFNGEETKTQVLRSMILPCRTTHSRVFPAKHSFSYSYLFVGVPVDLVDSTGSVVAIGDASGHRAWFSVHAQDYLARGEHKHGLSGKLKEYLESQGTSAGRYTCAYLVTAPRFLGFSFNPVSFWYLYDRTGLLSAMILEVNNTFDERRMYFMERKVGDNDEPAPAFSTSWSKDFHVSPFNDRYGSYSLTANDPAAAGQGVKVDNNIVLRDGEGKPKLVARVFSTGAGIDPLEMSTFQQWFFIARWWWVGFMTNPRILREARILWIKRLQVYYRPEVFKTSIGRNETVEERCIESFFKSFLVQLVDSYDEPISIVYTAAAGTSTGKVVELRGHHNSNDSEPGIVLKIHVTTPAWYHEIIRCQSIEDALSKYCFEAAAHEVMVHISDRDMLKRMLCQYRSIPRYTVQVRWLVLFNEWCVSQLRLRNIIPPQPTGLSRFFSKGKPHGSLSDFDLFVRLTESPQQYEEYLCIVRTVLLADCVAFGFAWLLSTYRYILRSLCFWYLYQQASRPPLVHDLGRVFSAILCTAVFHMVA